MNSADEIKLKYGYPTDCITIDDAIGRITKEIATLSVQVNSDWNYINALKDKKDSLSFVFNSQDCRNEIETTRLTETAALSTKYAIQSEKSIVSTGFKEQKIYIAIGSVVMLTALFLILKK